MEPYPPNESLYGNQPEPPAPVAPGLMDQLTGVFTEPGALFDRLRATPVWGGALGLLLVANAVVTVLWALRVDVDAMLRPVLEANPKIPPERIDDIIRMQAKFMLPVGLPVGLVFMVLTFLLSALVYWLVAKGTAEGERPGYVQAFSAVTVSSLVGLPRAILLAIICGLRNFGGATPDALSPTSLGFYLAPDQPKLHALYNSMDLFTFATLALTWIAARRTLRLNAAGAAICTAWMGLLTIVLPLFRAH